MKGYVYILKGINSKFYVGSTADIKNRIRQHQHGHTQTTRNMGKFNIALIQEYEDIKTARKIEFKIKGLKRKDYIEKIIKDGFIRIEL